MTLINSSLLAGLVLAVIPLILHLIMRARPKKLEFPALQLLRTRYRSNTRRMQLRHLLLLLLRCMLIAALVLLVARPSLPAARYGLLWHEWLVLGSVVLGSIILYAWLCRGDQAGARGGQMVREIRGRRRLWCVLGGFAVAMLAVGLPWGMRVRAELAAPSSEVSENLPVAAVFLLDTSLSMNYRHENLTRLEKAKEIAIEHLGQLPTGSRVAVAGLGADDDVVFQADLAGARSRLDSLVPTPVSESLNRRVRAAIQSQVDDRQRVLEAAGLTEEAGDTLSREICILTDLSQSAWKWPDDSGLADALRQHDWLRLYLVDVSVEQPLNTGISRPRLSEELTSAGCEITVSMTVDRTPSAAPAATLEMFLLNPDGSERRVARQLVQLDSGAVEAQLTVAAPTGQMFAEGFVRLTSSDPLPDDNLRYFSFGVQQPPRILFISETVDESFYLRNVLQPEEALRAGREFYSCTSISVSQASKYSLSDFDIVCIINCNSPAPSLWASLKNFLESGGGALVVTGSTRISANSWRTPECSDILPGLPVTQLDFLSGSVTLRVSAQKHPITDAFRESDEAAAELSRALFDKRWALQLNPGARVLMEYDAPSSPPALVERQVGSGRCLMLTSAVDNLVNGGSLWNNLVIDNWSFLMLSDEMIRYLTGITERKSNFPAGQAVELPVPAGQRISQYLVRRPGGRQTRADLPPGQQSVLITDAQDAGHYRVKPAEAGGKFEAVFAVNSSEAESDLTRITEDRLNELIGVERYSLVRNPADLERAAELGRLGVEIFPVLMGLVIVLFCAEHMMANFFYDEDPEPVVLTGRM